MFKAILLVPMIVSFLCRVSHFSFEIYWMERNILASGSADKKVKIWDVATGTCKITMEHHTKEVRT